MNTTPDAVRYLLISAVPDARRARTQVTVFPDAAEACAQFDRLRPRLQPLGGRAELAAVDASGRLTRLCAFDGVPAPG